MEPIHIFYKELPVDENNILLQILQKKMNQKRKSLENQQNMQQQDYQ